MHKLTPSAMPSNANEQQYSEALCRLTLYLQALGLPPADIQPLCIQALDTARATMLQPLLPAAMEALQILLAERELPQPPTPRPIRRQSMVPEPLERSLLGIAALAIAIFSGRLSG